MRTVSLFTENNSHTWSTYVCVKKAKMYNFNCTVDANTHKFSKNRFYRRVHTEWQWLLSGVHSIILQKLAQACEGGGCMPSPFHYSSHHVKVHVPAEWADTLTLFHPYPHVQTLWIIHSNGSSKNVHSYHIYGSCKRLTVGYAEAVMHIPLIHTEYS